MVISLLMTGIIRLTGLFVCSNKTKAWLGILRMKKD